jgi:hypothetical protein
MTVKAKIKLRDLEVKGLSWDDLVTGVDLLQNILGFLCSRCC